MIHIKKQKYQQNHKNILFATVMMLLSMLANAEVYQYNPDRFEGWSQIHRSSIPILGLTVQKSVWNQKEKKIILRVKTHIKNFKEDFIFCSPKYNYYYCAIEDDGGYIKIDKEMKIQLDIDFSKETKDGIVSELSLTQKKKKEWIKPLTSSPVQQATQCRIFDKKSEKEMFFRVKKRYPEITMDEIKKLKLGRYYDAKSGVSVVVPKAWKDITAQKHGIVQLIGRGNNSTREFAVIQFPHFWSDLKVVKPEDIIENTALNLAKISKNIAMKNGDSVKQIGRLKLFKHKSYIVGHFVHFSNGTKIRWESYTIIWNSYNLYAIVVISKKNELFLGEFLSSLSLESFCSEERE